VVWWPSSLGRLMVTPASLRRLLAAVSICSFTPSLWALSSRTSTVVTPDRGIWLRLALFFHPSSHLLFLRHAFLEIRRSSMKRGFCGSISFITGMSGDRCWTNLPFAGDRIGVFVDCCAVPSVMEPCSCERVKRGHIVRSAHLSLLAGYGVWWKMSCPVSVEEILCASRCKQ